MPETAKQWYLLPYDAWVSKLIAREAHNEGHEGVAGTLLKMRRKAWVIKGRRMVLKAELKSTNRITAVTTEVTAFWSQG